MLRISGGILRGRRLPSPHPGVRPTQDRVRQALFSAIAERVRGARVLDLFAGAGLLGLEACSRGAALVCWVESNRRAAALLRHSVRELCAGLPCETAVVREDVFRFLAGAGKLGPFDIALADPPYQQSQSSEYQARLMAALDSDTVLRLGGMFVIESGSDVLAKAYPVFGGLTLLKSARYGQTWLNFFERNGF